MKSSTAILHIILAAPILFSACATIGPPQPPSLDLPKPPADLRASRKGDRVTLTWTDPIVTTDRQTVRKNGPTWICRGAGVLEECGTPRAEMPAKSAPAFENRSKSNTQSTFTDTLPVQIQSDVPDASITYAVESLNPDKRGAGPSNQVHIPLLHTLPPPADFQAEVTNQGVRLSWNANVTEYPDSIHYLVRVYRRQEGSSDVNVVGEVPLTADRTYSLIDSAFEWQKTYEYRADTLTSADQPGKPAVQVEGPDTPEVKVFANDVFPPSVPTGLQAVFSGPGQAQFIDLVWAPVPDGDLAGYNVYRHDEGSEPLKLNADLLTSPAYRDFNVTPRQRYSYSVSAVDLRGNESARSDVASEAVP